MNFSIFTIIVTYYPNKGKLLSLIASYVSQTDQVIIVDNTDGDSSGLHSSIDINIDNPKNVKIISLGSNFGIAKAINIGISAARKGGATHVLLSDQDSNPSPDMVINLKNEFVNLSTHNKKIAAVGPYFYNCLTKTHHGFPSPSNSSIFKKRNIYPSVNSVVETAILITSGSLISIEALDEVGLMREELFIDSVDVEWCHRARAQEYKLYGIENAVMKHELGDDIVNIWLFGWKIKPKYGPIRVFYQIRNFIFINSLDYVPLSWKIRNLKSILGIIYIHLVFCNKRSVMIKSILSSIKAGVKKDMGPAKHRFTND